MTMPQSVRAVDGGRIKGAADVRQMVEIRVQFQNVNGRKAFIAFNGFNAANTVVNQALANSLMSSIGASWGSNLALFCPTTVSLQNVQVRDMTSHNNPIFISTGAAVPGTSASPGMPPETAAVLTEQIAARGKSLKGRAYVPGWATNADATGGLMAAGVQTGLNAWGTAIFNAITAGPLTPAVAQVARQQYIGLTGTVHPARSDGHINVTAYVCVDLQWDSQRRRGN